MGHRPAPQAHQRLLWPRRSTTAPSPASTAPPRRWPAGQAGNVLLIVDVAPWCGLTPQREGLEALRRPCRDQGLMGAWLSPHDFVGRQPGREAGIAEFRPFT